MSAHIKSTTETSKDVRVVGAELFLLPVVTRTPLKFGAETLTAVTCARAKIVVQGRDGRMAYGWGETPLSVQWAWPGSLSYAERFGAMCTISLRLAEAWSSFEHWGHPIEVGQEFLNHRLPYQAREVHASFPKLAALVCCSPFDIALHDAYGNLHKVPTYKTYNSAYMSRDLSSYLVPAEGSDVDFRDSYPDNFFTDRFVNRLPAWHLVGGLDPLTEADLDGQQPNDGYPNTLEQWIERDRLTCLKVKLRGNDDQWDHQRIVDVWRIGASKGVRWISADFNCTVTDPEYVNAILDRLKTEHPETFESLLYVEQPFPYELKELRIDARSVAARKPLFMDESAHDWKLVRLGESLGWNGVALKTCKTQTGALLSLCWAKAHGMQLMVQDLTNPMLALIPHVLLASHTDTIMGVETNATQFYPAASNLEAKIHPRLYRRRDGEIDISTIKGPGFGYRVEEIGRKLPEPSISCGEVYDG